VNSSIDSDEADTPNPTRRVFPDFRRKKGLLKQNSRTHVSQLNCRTLNTISSQKEIVVHLKKYNIPICAIQEHRILHKANDPDIVTKTLGCYTLFTASAWKASNNSTIGGIGIIIKSDLLSRLISVQKISDRILVANFRGNPKVCIISCYSPHNGYDEKVVEQFYTTLSNTTATIPFHSFLFICGDFNARIDGPFSYHQTCDRNGEFLKDYMSEFDLLATNTLFQKRRNSLWTWRSPTLHLSQIDFILCRKRWRNKKPSTQ